MYVYSKYLFQSTCLCNSQKDQCDQCRRKMKQLSQQLSQERLEKATLELQAQTLQGLKQTCADQEKELDALKLSVKVRLTCAAPDSSVDRAPDKKFRGPRFESRSAGLVHHYFSRPVTHLCKKVTTTCLYTAYSHTHTQFHVCLVSSHKQFPNSVTQIQRPTKLQTTLSNGENLEQYFVL